MKLTNKTALRYLLVLVVVFLLLLAAYVPHPSVLSKFYRTTSNTAITGRWEPRVSLSLVPVAAVVLPTSGQVLLWAADRANVFSNGTSNTLAVLYDPLTNDVSHLNVTTTHHNMFCPGLSIDISGRPVITGGSTSDHTSIYDGTRDLWIVGPSMETGRGYHSQTTLSDGRIFTIGGSWSGGVGEKNGEALDLTKGTWSALPEALVTPLLTKDRLGTFAADNHAWLFAWRDGSVFQAGPSAALNWYGTHGNGSTSPAGRRGQDGDAMNGNAVMYDAVAGKILTLGGAWSYSDAPATRSAHLMTLSAPFDAPTVEELAPMHYPRAYANSVVLPTGDVFVTGGASYARQWTDANATMVPEIWSPRTRRFTRAAPMPIPRTYHSFALLLPDARVLTGGGGLCWEACLEEGVNHMDVQVFTPPYLLGRDGRTLAARPKIVEISHTHVEVGGYLVVMTDVDVAEFSLVRYGSATHAINTDQRRVKLEAIPHPPTFLDAGKQSRVKVPADPGIVIPGYWMLFAISSDGVPSIAETLFIEAVETVI